MTARLFRSMTPDMDSRKPYHTGPLEFENGETPAEHPPMYHQCDRCGALYYAGDWPFCDGTPESHRRD
jgi:hypothetical protein